MITAANPVHAVLFLVLVFCQAAARRLVLEAEFRALLLLVVYVGAIAVLFLFVVRRLNVQPTPRRRGEGRRRLPRAGGVGALVLGELARVHAAWVPAPGGPGLAEALEADGGAGGAAVAWVDAVDGLTNLQARGQILYTHAFLYFLRASLVLLVARVGAIVLTLPSAPLPSQVPARRQQLHEQLARDRERAVVLLRKDGAAEGRGR